MRDEELFYILTIVNMILNNDFGLSHSVVERTQNKDTVGYLFKSNCKRFSSLNNIKSFEHAL